MPTINATVKFDRAIEFEDSSGVSFNIRRKSDNVIRETIPNSSISHEPGLQSPADTFLYVMTSVETLQGGDQSDILEYVYSGDGTMAGLAATQNILTSCWAGEPIWASADIPIEGNWTTGQDVALLGIDLNNSIISNRDIAGTTFTIDTAASTTPNGGNLPSGVTLNANGTITGVVDGVQGGLYLMVFVAANQYGSSKTTGDINLQVSLEVTAPEMNAIPPATTKRLAAYQINIADSLSYDGDPSATAQLTYTLDATSVPMPAGLSLSSAGLISGAVEVTVDLILHSLVIRVTNANEVDLFTLAPFDLTVQVEAAVNAPLVTGWFSGQADCVLTGTPPTWKAGSDTFFIDINDDSAKSIDMIGLYLAATGGKPITSVVLSSGTLPTGMSLDAVTGFITGNLTTPETPAEYPFTLTAANADAISIDSPTFTFDIFDNAAVAVTIDNISASEGSNDVSVVLSEACFTPAGDAASYEEGFSFTVNNSARNRTYKSGGGTNTLVFTLDGVAFTGSNTIALTYTT